MSKEISKQLDKCPFCDEELEQHCTGRYYMHKLNGCILQHFCFEDDDVESIEKWNIRKPIERIVERLEEYRDDFMNDVYEELREDADNCRANRIIDRFDEVTEIVKEEGRMNE